MTTARSPRPDGGHGHGDGGGRVLLGRAAILAVIGVVLGVLALQAGQHNGLGASTTTTTTTTTTLATGTTTTTAPKSTSTTTVPAAAPSASIKVEVTNASKVTHVAAYYTGKLSADGWGTLTPQSATTHVSTTAVYYASGQQASANGVAKSLGLATGVVQAESASMPVGHPESGADVVVVIGTDLASKVPSATT